MSGNSELRVDGKRLWDSIMSIAEIGPGQQGGSCRLALTDEDREGRDLFIGWCREIGCSIRIDDLGNIFARRDGRNNDLPPVVAGSHLDTQPHGGKFDGIYGVLAALEAMRCLHDNSVVTEAPLEVVVWTNEEGSRFAPAMIASGVYAGLFDKDYAWARTDSEGKTLGDELERIGYKGDMACGSTPIGALLEAHIEQGPILEADQNQIGVVIGGQGQRWYDVTVKGQDSHAGSTPMPGRRDALVAASDIISRLQQLALEFSPRAVATVGEMSVMPNSRNTMPGEVRTPEVEQALPGPGRLSSGICGAKIHDVSQNFVENMAQIKRELKADFIICGVGGIMTAEHFVERLEAGADIAMSATAIMWDPFLAARYHELVAGQHT